VLLRTAYLYEQNNAGLIRPLESVRGTIEALFTQAEEDTLSLKLVEDAFFLNKTLIRMDQGTFQNAEFLKVICDELDIGEWEFRKGCGEDEFRAVMKTIVAAVRGSSGTQSVLERDLKTIQLKPRTQATQCRQVLGKKSMLQVYATAMAFAAGVVAAWASGKRQQLSGVKRVVQRVVGAVNDDPLTMLGLTNLRSYKTHLASHFVNVSIVSLLLARRVGLGKLDLVRVGMTAFLHELGASLLPDETIDAAEPLDDAQSAELDKLPLLSVSCLAEMAGGKPENPARIVSVYESQAYKAGGQPYRGEMLPDVFSEIVSTADAYDHLITSRMGHAALPPHKAIEQMLRAQGDERFARWAVGLLVNEIGSPPCGTLVEIDTGELGIVVGGPALGGIEGYPIIRLIADKNRVPIVGGPILVNLGSNGAGGDQRVHAIRRILTPVGGDGNIPQFFLD
jgi:HD-GYP domain-containing protein (c-di-GMP phosphodiesterase class II)